MSAAGDRRESEAGRNEKAAGADDGDRAANGGLSQKSDSMSPATEVVVVEETLPTKGEGSIGLVSSGDGRPVAELTESEKKARVKEMERELEGKVQQFESSAAKLVAAVKADKEKQPDERKRRWAKIKGSSKGEHLVVEPLSCSTRLKEYLALPVEEYNLLDPKWINRDSGEPNVFHFKVPLNQTVGLKLEPQLWVAVDIDTKREEVQFSSSRFKFGEKDLDFVLEEVLKFEFSGKLSYRAEGKVKRLGDVKRGAKNVTRVGRLDAEQDIVDVEVAGEKGEGAALPGEKAGIGEEGLSNGSAPGTSSVNSNGRKPADPTKDWDDGMAVQAHKMRLEVTTQVQLKLPAGSPPGTGLMMSSAGKLILKAAQQALAAAFVRLVAEDYRQWTAKPGGGKRESTGSLVAAAPAESEEQPVA